MIKSDMTMRGRKRALWLRAAQEVSPVIFERMREIVRAKQVRVAFHRLGVAVESAGTVRRDSTTDPKAARWPYLLRYRAAAGSALIGKGASEVLICV
jgi:hypothetical protein